MEPLVGRPLVVLARWQGAGAQDQILAGGRRAGFPSRWVPPPSVGSIILRCFRSGVGIGIVPPSLGDTAPSDRWSLPQRVPSLILAVAIHWKQEHEEPPKAAFRTLVTEWRHSGRI